MMDRHSLIQQLPKVELHAHLNGCIREATLFELAKERGVTLNDHHFMTKEKTNDSGRENHNDENDNTDQEEDDHGMYNVRPRSLQDCFDMFADIALCVTDLSALKRITLEALEDFAAHQVAYLELRSTPKRLLSLRDDREWATKDDYCQTIIHCMQEFETLQQHQRKKSVMTCRLLVAIDRSGSIEDATEHVELASRLRTKYPTTVVGIDLGGNPLKNDFADFLPAFQLARKAGLKITLHCGEVPCQEPNSTSSSGSVTTDNDRNTKAYQEVNRILDFHPDRLGHALLLPPSLQRVLLQKAIPVESCPTSNVMTLELSKHCSGSLLDGILSHPQLQSWLHHSHPITIGTDDPGVFDTTPTKELMLLQKGFRLTTEDIVRIVLRSMDFAFCDDDTKQHVLAQMQARIKDLLPYSNVDDGAPNG